jgi:hypothetical protein
MCALRHITDNFNLLRRSLPADMFHIDLNIEAKRLQGAQYLGSEDICDIFSDGLVSAGR